MDQKFNTAFIPKKFLSEDVASGSTSKYVQRRNVVGPGYFIAILIFIAAVGASVALFAYTRIVEGAVETKINELKAQMSELKAEDLTELVELERQMRYAAQFLDKHIAASEVLHKLEEKTIRDVRYAALEYRRGDASPELSLSGQTRALANVGLQLQEFENERLVTSLALTNLERDPELGLVAFGVKLGIAPELVSYQTAVKEDRHGKAPVPALPTRPAQTQVLVATSSSVTP